MSEIVHVVGDLSGLASKWSEWQKRRIDQKAVGKLTRHIGPLQEETNSADALALVEEIAGVGGRLVVDEGAGTVSLRAVVTDHQLHDLAAPLIGAFRRAGELGGRGVLWLVEGATDAPGFGHRLDVDESGALVRALSKRELGKSFVHPAPDDLATLEAALVEAPPAPVDHYPAAMREVPRTERACYQALWDVVAGADEAALLAAVKHAAERAPGASEGAVIARLSALTSGAEIVALLHKGDAGRVRGYLSEASALAAWIDPTRTTGAVAGARVAGAPPRYLCAAIPGLAAANREEAEREAWAIFEATSEDPKQSISLWHGEHMATWALARATAPSTLVERLDAALARKRTKAEERRILAFCLMLAHRSDDPAASPALERALAATTQTLHACVEAYATERGWKRSPT